MLALHPLPIGLTMALQHITLDSDTATGVIVTRADGTRAVFFDLDAIGGALAGMHYAMSEQGLKSDDYLSGFGDAVINIAQSRDLNLLNDEIGA